MVILSVLGATVVLALASLARQAVAADRRARAEIELIIRADLEQLIENTPVPEWPPGVERFFEIIERDRVPPIVIVRRQHLDSL